MTGYSHATFSASSKLERLAHDLGIIVELSPWPRAPEAVGEEYVQQPVRVIHCASHTDNSEVAHLVDANEIVAQMTHYIEAWVRGMHIGISYVRGERCTFTGTPASAEAVVPRIRPCDHCCHELCGRVLPQVPAWSVRLVVYMTPSPSLLILCGY